MNDLWLPTGHLESWGLHIERMIYPSAGFFIPNSGWKLTWHTTETNEDAVRSLCEGQFSQRDTPHFCIGLEDGREHYTAIQMLSLHTAAKCLEHPAGTKETNLARTIQVEVCGYAINAQDWRKKKYQALAALACLIDHRVPIPRKAPRSFTSTANNRYTQQGWIAATGHNGHQHAASQPHNHWDPGRLRIAYLFDLMKEMDH